MDERSNIQYVTANRTLYNCRVETNEWTATVGDVCVCSSCAALCGICAVQVQLHRLLTTRKSDRRKIAAALSFGADLHRPVNSVRASVSRPGVQCRNWQCAGMLKLLFVSRVNLKPVNRRLSEVPCFCTRREFSHILCGRLVLFCVAVRGCISVQSNSAFRPSGVGSASKMTYIVSGGALNSTHSLPRGSVNE